MCSLNCKKRQPPFFQPSILTLVIWSSLTDRLLIRFYPCTGLIIESNSRKAKLHLGSNLNHGIPGKLFLTEGKEAERPFVSQLVKPGQKVVLDRGYQAHHLFDQWQDEGPTMSAASKKQRAKRCL